MPGMMLDIAGVKIGYPVIDTTDSMGLICSRNTNQLAVNKICNMIGHKKVFPNYYTFCTFDIDCNLGFQVTQWCIWESLISKKTYFCI